MTWIKKYRWLCIGLMCLIVIVGSIIYLAMIYPRYSVDVMDNVEIDTTLDDYIHCDNCDTIDYLIVDEHGQTIDDPQVNTTYQVKITLKSDWISLSMEKPVRFIDTIAPTVNISNALIELDYEDDFDIGMYYEVSDNHDEDIDITMVKPYDASIYETMQTIEANACDTSGNCTTFSIDVIHHQPQCGDHAYFDGTSCVCEEGYEGDAMNGCESIIVPKPVSSSSAVGSPPQAQSQSTQQAWVEPQPTATAEPQQPEYSWDEPSWGFVLNDDESFATSGNMADCVAAGEADHGKPDGARGYACLLQGDTYTLTWYDQANNVVATIPGY